MALVCSCGFTRSRTRRWRPPTLVRIAALLLTAVSGRAVANATPSPERPADLRTNVQSVSLVPVADSAIRSAVPGSNFGDARSLRARGEPRARNVLVRFDQREINQLVGQGTLVGATL